MTTIKDYFAALGAAAGATVEPDESGAVMMTMQDRPCMIRYIEGEDRFLFYSQLGMPCGFGTQNLYHRLLSANFLLAETFSGALGLEPSGAVGLTFAISVSGDVERFVSDVHARALVASEWAQRFSQWNAHEESEAAKRQDAVLSEDPDQIEPPSMGPGGFSPEFLAGNPYV